MFRAWTLTIFPLRTSAELSKITAASTRSSLIFVPGVRLKELPNDKKAPVIDELEGYVAQMRTIKSKVMGGFLGDVIVPRAVPHDQVLKLREATNPRVCSMS